MKSNTKIKQLMSKGLLLSGVLFCSLHGIAQRERAVKADPKLGSISFTDLSGYKVDEASVQPNELIKLKIPVLNSNYGKALPAGSCKIKIGFGSKLILDPSFNLNNAVMSNYFKWTSDMNSGQLQVTGELINPLPANVKDLDVAFKVKGASTGTSTITANFLITNHKTKATLSDVDGSNNTAYLKYTVSSRPAPVSTTTIANLSKTNCSLNIAFSTDKEINLVRYEVEASKDGAIYEKIASVNAVNNSSYSTSFELPASLQAEMVIVRIKSIDRNGSFVYSSSRSVNGQCAKQSLQLGLYPNPAKGFTPLMIKANQGIFNGRYKVKMSDMSGKTVAMEEVVLNNVTNFKFNFGHIASGKYIIQVTETENNAQVGVLKFEKL